MTLSQISSRSFAWGALLLVAIVAQSSASELSQADWEIVGRSPGIVVSRMGRPSVQIIFDANCPNSARLHEHLQRKALPVSIRWVPVAWMRPSSLKKAAALLTAPDPTEALRDNFNRYDFKRYEGAIVPASVPRELPQQIETLQSYWRTWIGGTPTVIVRTADGHVLLHAGVADLAAIDALIAASGSLQPFEETAGKDLRRSGSGP